MSLMLFVGLAAQAQRGQGGQGGQRGQQATPEAAAKTQAEALQEKLGLSDDQYTKTYDVLLASGKERTEKLAEMRASGDRAGMREMTTKLQEESDKKLKEIFSETQWVGYEKWKAERASQRGGRGGGRGGN